MSAVVILLILAVILFASVFFTGRRFGALGLSLAAGSLLSEYWVGGLTPLVAESGIVVVRPPLESIVAVVLTLLPSAFLLISGPSYKTTVQKIIGSTAYALLAVALLLGPLHDALVFKDVGIEIYQLLHQYQVPIISACLILAVFDIMGMRSPKHDKSKH